MVMLVKAVQPLNASLAIVVSPSFRRTVVSDVQFLKLLLPTMVVVEARSTSRSLLKPVKLLVEVWAVPRRSSTSRLSFWSVKTTLLVRRPFSPRNTTSLRAVQPVNGIKSP